MSTLEQPGESDLYFLYFRNIDDTLGRGVGVYYGRKWKSWLITFSNLCKNELQ